MASEYEGHSRSFARACRQADRERRKQEKQKGYSPKSTLHWIEHRHPDGRLIVPSAESMEAYAYALRREKVVTHRGVVEALVYELATRGLECFSTPANGRRLRECDKAAMEEIAKRLGTNSGQIREPWPSEKIEQLLRLRAALGKRGNERTA
jgi:hypothetical protein